MPNKGEEEGEGYSVYCLQFYVRLQPAHVVYFNNKIIVLFPFGLSMLSALGFYLTSYHCA